MTTPRAILTALLLTTLAGCKTNPATGRSQLLLYSAEQTAAMGEAAVPELVDEYGGEVESPELREYVAGIGRRLVRQVEPEYEDIEWDFFVLDSDVINAFALPGGNVFISRALLEEFDNEAQVAGVLGHEIGHVTGRHVDERLSQALAVQGIAVGAGVAAGGSDSDWVKAAVPVIVGVGGQGFLLKFGRDQESESDEQGVKYMTAAGYDPRGMVEVLQILAAASKGPRPPEILSTHPNPDRRIGRVQALIKGPYQYTQSNDSFRLYRTRFRRYAAPHLSSE